MTDTYILNTNDQARERLIIQHHLYANNSISLVRNAGILKGMKGLEIGCGSGAMTRELADLVGPQGSLLSIDLSQEQVNYAQETTQEYTNIVFKAWDVNYLLDLGEKFDFIYCRMVLHHVADAHSVILQMHRCLNPGGIIICEEPSLFDSTFCSPHSNAYIQFTQWVRACFIQNKRDFEIAYRLEQEFSSCNMTIKHHSLYQPLLRTPQEKQIYPMAINDLYQQIIDLKIATVDEINSLSSQLIQLAQSDNTMSWLRMHSIVAIN